MAVPSVHALPALPEPVEDFGLFDHQGRFHRLHYYHQDPETRAIALFSQGNGCPLVRKRFQELNQLQRDYRSKGVQFWMINSNSHNSREEIASEADEFGCEIPILVDDAQLVGEALQLTRTAEVLLIETKNWHVLYRGPIDDRLGYEAEKPKADRHYLRDAIAALLAGRAVDAPVVNAPGCRIAYPHRRAASPPDTVSAISYRDTIAPMLQNHCVRCHTKGGIGPFAMSSARKVRGWSEMIREVVMTRRMPPWQADPHFGAFSNDFSLSPEQRQQLVTWIDQGCPIDDSPDPLANAPTRPVEWSLGEPDHVIDIAKQAVPAQGIIDYRYITIDSPFDHDVWIRGVDVRPGNTRVLHHVIAFIHPKGKNSDEDKKWLAGYAPGMGPDPFPDGTGVLLKANEQIQFQLHYTASGVAEIDDSKLGLYLADDGVDNPLETEVILESEFEIPPHDRAFTQSKSKRIRHDILLYSMNPHMHFRGKAMSFTVRYPDGSDEVLLSVPHYNFNWQRSYRLAEPKRLPKGSVVTVTATWDNSSLNPANPDPSREVGWGEQSFDEMLFATYQYKILRPKNEKNEDLARSR